MRTYERNGVHVDQCADCRGIFLDRGELERLVDAENAWHGDPHPAQPAAAAHSGDRYRDDDRSHSDDDRYRTEQRAASSGGLGAVVGEVLQQVQGRQHSSSSYGSAYPRKKKKESFLSDLFG